ncbi:condensation domain-containing protein, partial [Francisella philomiragia]|uniref:condensation domain-containing protein n=1 Tax=Francisella philomiragia TaxID=28110 RepID=UPI001C9DFA92
MHQVHGSVVQAQEHQDLPFEKLVTSLNIEHDQSRHPIFQVMFGVQSFGSRLETQLFESLNSNYKISKFDIECFIDDSQQKLHVSTSYAISLFKKESIERLITNYQQILEQVIDDKDLSIKNYNLLNKQDYQRIVYDWNKTDNDYPRDKTVYELFEE